MTSSAAEFSRRGAGGEVASRLLCAHCGDPVPPKLVPPEGEPGYCCSGCEAAAIWIRGHGLESFYQRRTEESPRPEQRDLKKFASEAFERRHVRTLEDGTAETSFRIEGLRCAACVWLNERALASVPGVVDAHVSYGTSRATIRYRPEAVGPGGLAEVIGLLGYQPSDLADAPRATGDDLLTRLGVAAFCAANVMMLHVSLYLGAWSGDMELRFQRLFQVFTLALATPTAVYSASPFFSRAWSALKHRVVSMDLPIAFAIAVMYVHGVVVTFGRGETYLDSMTMLIAFLLAGRFVESRGRARASEAAEEVLALAPRWSTIRRGNDVEVVESTSLQRGDVVVVAAGEALAADGCVLDGSAEIDASHVTGEPGGVFVSVGDEVASGCVVVSGRVDVRVEATGAASTAGRIAALVSAAVASRSEALRLADRVAPYFVAVVGSLAAICFALWYASSGFDAALKVGIALLVVACPCALSLAAPAALIAGVGAAARRGAFVANAAALEQTARVSCAGIDKTGTLTEARMRVVRADDEVLALAAAVEVGSPHPIARAIVEEARKRRIAIVAASEIVESPGRGIRGLVHARMVECAGAEGGEVAVRRDGVEIGRIELASELRSSASHVVAALGCPVTILSGDDHKAVEEAAQAAGATAWHGRMLPEEKLAWVQARQAEGEVVLFAGDGVNDAAAIAAADVGVAMRSGAEAGIRAADIVVLTDSLRPVASALSVAAITQRAVRTNAIFAIIYNVSAVGLAAAGLITPVVAAILMPISSAVVLWNAGAVEGRVRRSDP